nr:hypothetical protein [Tanacetum cinerariifolium]
MATFPVEELISHSDGFLGIFLGQPQTHLSQQSDDGAPQALQEVVEPVLSLLGLAVDNATPVPTLENENGAVVFEKRGRVHPPKSVDFVRET